MKKIALTHATIWVTIYWAIAMLLFGLSGYLLCLHFGNTNNILFAVFLSLSTYLLSLTVGYMIFINLYKHFNKKQH